MKKVVFCFSHIMQFSQLVTLKYVEQNECEPILLYDTDTANEDFIKRIKQSEIFDLLIPYSENKFYMVDTEQSLIKSLTSYFDEIFEKAGCSVDSISYAYTAGEIANSFALYAVIKNIKFSLFETRPGLFKDSSRYNWGYKDGWLSASYKKMQIKYGTLCGEKNLFDTIVYPGCGWKNRKCREFDFNGLFSSLDPKICTQILSCFDLSDVGVISGDVQLLLTNSISHTVNTTVFSEKLVPYVYQLMLDYYGNDYKLLIKQHPHDRWDFSDQFKNATKLKPDFPIEMIRLIKGMTIKSIISGYTTSAWRIIDLADEWKQTGLKFYRYAHILHEIRVVIDLCIKNGIKKIRTNIPTEFLSTFISVITDEIQIVEADESNNELVCVMCSSTPMETNPYKKTIMIDDVGCSLADPEQYDRIQVTTKKSDSKSIAPETLRFVYVRGIDLSGYMYEADLYYESLHVFAFRYVEDIGQVFEGAMRGELSFIKIITNCYYHGIRLQRSVEESAWWGRLLTRVANNV